MPLEVGPSDQGKQVLVRQVDGRRVVLVPQGGEPDRVERAPAAVVLADELDQLLGGGPGLVQGVSAGTVRGRP